MRKRSISEARRYLLQLRSNSELSEISEVPEMGLAFLFAGSVIGAIAVCQMQRGK